MYVSGEMFVIFHGGLRLCYSAFLRLWEAVQDVAALGTQVEQIKLFLPTHFFHADKYAMCVGNPVILNL